MISYIVGIGCSAILAAAGAFALLNDNSGNKNEIKSDSYMDWPDDNCCHYEGDF